jgi:hypothetical protein
MLLRRLLGALAGLCWALPALAQTVTVNVANAPAWAASTSYSTTGHLGNRVVSGAGLNPGGSPTYNTGSALYLLELTTAGTTGSGQPTISSCPSTGITDGTAVWKCLTVVDYITFTSAMFDDLAWQPSTTYYYTQYVRSSNTAWRNSAGSSAPYPSCTSGTTAPNGSTEPFIDGTCSWYWDIDGPAGAPGDIPYFSGRVTPWLHQLVNNSGGFPVIQNQENYLFNIWDGGVVRPQYVGGANGETSPMTLEWHQMFVTSGEASPYCYGSTPPSGFIIAENGGSSATNGCPSGNNQMYTITITAAPGDSFQDVAPGIPLYYDYTKGVALYDPTNDTWHLGDTNLFVSRLQLKTGGTGQVAAFEGALTRADYEYLYQNIFDGAGYCTLTDDANGWIVSNLIVNHSTVTGSGGICTSYQYVIENNTIIGTGSATNSSAIQYINLEICFGYTETCQKPRIQNNNMFGFAEVLALLENVSTFNSGLINNNVTDLASGANNGTTFTSAFYSPDVMTVLNVGGSANQFSQTEAATFIQPNVGTSTPDFRILSGSASKGNGITYSQNTSSWLGTILNTPDIFGQALSLPTPDVGAAQFQGGGPPPFVVPAYGDPAIRARRF